MDKTCIAYTDGSYNPEKRVYGYGAYLIFNGEIFRLSGCDSKDDMKGLKGIAGEILAVMVAIEKAITLEAKEIIINYDFAGIENWATNKSKRRKNGAKMYYNYIQMAKEQIHIEFRKVKAHSGNELNNRADKLARKAVGLKW